MINETTLAEFILPHTIDDHVTFHRLSCVSRRFNQVAKRMLIRREQINYGCKYIWTELPGSVGGRIHGLYRIFLENGLLHREYTYHQGSRHGRMRGWYAIGGLTHLTYEWNYYQGKLHGLQHEWHINGQLVSEENYHHGKQHGCTKKWNTKGQLVTEEQHYHGNLQCEKYMLF